MFSRRLAWSTPENALAAAERRLRAAGAPLLDLTVSNPTAVALPDRGAALAAAFADPAIARYLPSAPGPRAARELVAAEQARLGARVAPDRIVLSASSSESYSWLFKLLCDPGDVVLVPEPSYPLFDYLAALEGLATRRYRLVWAGEWQIDWSSVAAALPGARVVTVVNPNNPTGSFLRAPDLARLGALAAAHDAALIFDEVFADYANAAPADAVRSVAAVPLPGLGFALGGLSKSAGLPQLKLGWITVLGPEVLAAPALSHLALIADTYLSVGTPVLSALPRLLPIGAALRADLTARIADNRACLARLVTRAAPLTALAAEGGWSAILRVPAQLGEEAWALALLEEDGVVVQPGYFFDLTGLGSTLVVSLLTLPEVFAAGIARIVARAAALADPGP